VFRFLNNPPSALPDGRRYPVAMPMPPDPSTPPPPPPNRRKPDAAAKPTKGGKREPSLKRTVVRPARIAIDPVDGAYISDRMTTLTHELANLLDGSMRCLSLARRGVASETPPAKPATAGEVARHLDTVHAAMHQMAELVKCAMQGVPLAQAPSAGEGTGSMAEAVRHAIEVMSPLTDERCLRVSGDIAAELAELPDRFIFAIVTNAIRNAVESIERSGRGDGAIDIFARTEAGRTGRCVVIEILDNGEGPPELPARGGESVFRLGYSTKRGGTGVGLALCRELVQELGGTIVLAPRELEPASGRGGASLRATFPIPRRKDHVEDDARP